MIPTFTIVTTLITVGVTALLIGVLMRINDPRRQERGRGGDAPLVADTSSGRNARQENDQDGDSGGDGGGDGGGGD